MTDSEFDVVLTDLNMPGFDGLSLCVRLSELRPDVPVVVMTAFGSLDTAIAAIRAGAYDFVTKPIETEALVLVIERAARHRELERRVRALRRAVETTQRFDELLGESPPMRKLFDMLERLRTSEASVLIVGESGTGKELVARALHRRGPRAAGAFVAINSAAMPEALLESELFGHVRGAFTDARADHKGLIEQASGGTLLLDEIGDMPLGIQAKLLRVLEDHRIRPVGSEREVPVDVRVIAATHRDLESAIEAGRFREDLYFRINVVTIRMPPLRDRAGDIPILIRHFIAKIAKREGRAAASVSPEALDVLSRYAWPGNVRELENAIERAVAIAKGNVALPSDLPAEVYGGSQVAPAGIVDDRPTLAELEKRYIAMVLAECGGNKKRAAEKLGIDRRTLYRAIERWGDTADGDDDSDG
jgi:two-component system response regulator HydG